VDSECPLPPSDDVTPIEDLHVLAAKDLDSIAKKRIMDSAFVVVRTDYTEIRPLIQIILSLL
jgi:hypothetical protein